MPIPIVLLVVGNAASPPGPDLATSNRLESLGYQVQMISDEIVTAGDADGKALVFISATTDSTILGATMRDVLTPVIVCESNLYDDMGLAVVLGSALNQDAVAIVDPGHPLAASLSGTVTVYTANNQLRWGNPQNSAALVATTADDDGAIFGYETGAQMFGLTAPARRVGFFFSATTGAVLSSEGWQLFDAAVFWAASP